MNPINKAFGAYLRKLRIEKGFTQEQLAENADISVSFLGGIERGLKSPTLETVQKLANALNTSISKLMTFEQKEASDKETQLNKLINEFVTNINDLYKEQ